MLAGWIGTPHDEITYTCAGLNHMAWYLKYEWNGRDPYPLIRKAVTERPEIYNEEIVRNEMFLHLDYYVTESSGHTSEYSAYFRKRPDLVKKYDRGEYRGESGFYARNWPTWRLEGDQEIRDYLSGQRQFDFERGPEYASYIMEAIETGQPTVIYGNVLNTGLIDNLPRDGVVEVACLVDRKGVQPTHFGRLPTQLAALDQQHMAFHDLVATAILEQEREAAVQPSGPITPCWAELVTLLCQPSKKPSSSILTRGQISHTLPSKAISLSPRIIRSSVLKW